MRLAVAPHVSKLFVVSSYLLVSAMPFVPLLLGREVSDWTQLLGMQVIAWMMLWAVCKRPAYFHPVLLPAFIAIPLDLYLQAYYGQPLSAHHLAIIAETNPGEAMEFLGHHAWLASLLVLFALAWWGACWRLCWRSADLDWTDRSRRVLLTVFGVAGVLLLHGSFTGGSGQAPRRVVRSDPSFVSSRELPALPSWATFSINTERFGRTRPLGLSVAAYEFWKERQHLAALSDSSRTFRFGAVQAEDSDASRTIVMVIGESSRYDRWRLNGYERDTNPLLRTETNLVSLSDVVSAVSATRLSVPVMVSRKPARSSLKAGFSEKSFLSAFREAGYKTWWVSNQMSFGEFDTPVSVFAKEAHVVQFLNFGSYKKRSS